MPTPGEARQRVLEIHHHLGVVPRAPTHAQSGTGPRTRSAAATPAPRRATWYRRSAFLVAARAPYVMAQSVVKFTAAMEAPHVKMDDSGRVVVTVAAPKGTSHVAVYFYEAQAAGEIKRMVEAEGKLLEEGAVGRTMKCTIPSAPFEARRYIVVSGITPDTQYTVAYSTRGPDDLSFGPESPRSLPKTFPLPLPAAVPVVSKSLNGPSTAARVFYSAPFGCREIEIVFTNEAGDHEVRDKISLHNPESRSGCKEFSGLNKTDKYTVTSFSLNCAGKIASPSTSYCAAAAAHLPIAPCPPLVEVLGETSVRVSYTVPPYSAMRQIPTQKMIINFETGGKEFAVNAHTHQMLPIESPQNFNFQARNASIVVTGLSADTTYSISVKAGNGFGTSLPSPATTVTTEKSEVEVTRVRSSEERDAELIKGAVDVDGENAAPNAKRAKQ